uniref:Uncharacterized protein n=1 Tax=Panagrolaimus sp. JU765 TaxID=591449 RepID=A0AC34RJG6_9BILA
MLNPDLLLDICNQLLGSNDASISKIQALNKFRLSGKECFWAFENAAKSAVSARLRFLNKTQHFSLIVQYKHDIKAELPYLPEDDNTLFIKALENIKVLSLGNVSVLP